jgi:hypothetical protein
MATKKEDQRDEKFQGGTGEAKPQPGPVLVGNVAIPGDTVAPNGVRVTPTGAEPAKGVVSKGNTDDPQHILVADPKKAGAPEDVNKGVPEDEGGSNPPAFNADGLRPGEAVDFETIRRHEQKRREAERQAEAPKGDSKAK